MVERRKISATRHAITFSTLAAMVAAMWGLATYIDSTFIKNPKADLAHIQIQINELEARDHLHELTNDGIDKLNRLRIKRNQLLGIE